MLFYCEAHEMFCGIQKNDPAFYRHHGEEERAEFLF